MEVKEPSAKYLMDSHQYAVSEVNSKLPAGWRDVTLGALAESIERGASPRPIDSPAWFDATSSIGWVRISDVTKSGRRLIQTTQQLSTAGVRASRFVPSGSLIMSICATVGRPIETALDVCIHDGFVVFTKPRANQSFLYHLLKALEPQWVNSGQTGSQMNLNTDLIRRERVALPPENEQAAIADALTDADALIDSLEQLLTKKRQIKQGAMQELLTGKRRLLPDAPAWRDSSLGQLGRWFGGMTPSMARTDYWAPQDVPWLSSGDIKISRLMESAKSVSTRAVTDGATTVAPARSLVVVMRSGILRKYFPVAMTLRPMAINQDLKALVPSPEVMPEFLLHALTYCGESILASCLKAGTTVESIEFGWLKQFTIKLPSEPEQKAIATALTEIDLEIDAIEARLVKARALKQAMAQALLTGRIRLVEPTT